MEYLLCGIPMDCDYLIKYIKLSEDACVHERVSEVIYYLSRYTVIISNTEHNDNSRISNSIFSIIYPADKNKSRKCLYRRRFSSNYICDNIEYIMSELGCTNKVVRIYDRVCYKYNNASIIIIKNKNKKIIIAKSDRPDGEVILEEIKDKLKLWVNLITPPEDIHKYIP
ncbi:hypothetical protein NEPAR06_1856 [Nematocida parisii]|uniref:Uncharacterized protein n=1 Tax=Nematocida parisii (strain ERTm3) TaxID=935791 RepID=I3EGT5_NEMP3|nr:uncharacterized protein NEPG_00208 [Nematocida parisii ERTm1]EIJ88432.1 hypothetical protein NEQG_01122 [Nematocida parisii ERTm3]KAI5130124.1 hypothetical protein NEPAR03_1974 [Nematocida parisii]EIJ94685.1 hypothetical protein NEPG_00208 [Nematocida parisii ERTm1]KAI5130453.1 hypothetical protein NEPAR08_2036 [Nematocida parisii]KAI5143483.1 hypothetical protein NEPAR04_1872 [Nematocida parisii]|eukprot:XP_013058041.1 hypothetical protein NEPG_00208 [Nematocida parisii ERTm1]